MKCGGKPKAMKKGGMAKMDKMPSFMMDKMKAAKGAKKAMPMMAEKPKRMAKGGIVESVMKAKGRNMAKACK